MEHQTEQTTINCFNDLGLQRLGNGFYDKAFVRYRTVRPNAVN